MVLGPPYTNFKQQDKIFVMLAMYRHNIACAVRIKNKG